MYILSKTTSRETIGEILKNTESLTPLFYRIFRHSFVDRLPSVLDNVIRWGLTVTEGVSITGIEFNKASAIKLTSNKGKCRQVLHDGGIAVPKPVSNDRYGTFRTRDTIVRPMFHQKGKDFKVVKRSEYLSYDTATEYASEYYPKTSEFRVHVAHGKVLIVQEKLQTSYNNSLNWNHEAGYVFEVVSWRRYRKEIVRLAIDTIEMVGLDFGAVDIMADPEDDSLPIAVVCEVNSSPKLEEYTAERYSEYFDWLSREKETRHFNVPEGTRARHYAFKHRELQYNEYDYNFIQRSDGYNN